ncbi:Parp12, partial [Symbiodinium necroappetens]
MPVAHLRLAASWLSRIQTVYRNAWALCGAAHLNNLKAFDKRVLDLALPDLADSSLRGPTTQELLTADRKIWGTTGSLVSSGWSLDEALYEVTSIRSDLSNLLQPRPRNALPSTPNKGRERPNTPTPPPPKRTRTTPFTPPKNPKGKGKGGKQGKGPANKAKSEDWPSNWVYKAHGKVLRKRYQRNLCTVGAPDASQSDSLPSPPLVAGQEIASFKRKFANRIWTSPAYKQAIPFLEPSSQPSEQESGLILQCLWARSIIAVIASLPTIVPDTEEQSQALEILCSALDLDLKSMAEISP